jgi:hypothetical protein
MVKAWSRLLCGLGLWLTPTAVTFAQSAPAPVAVHGAAPDVVRLKDGSLLRGTISELLAGDSVTIVTVTGEVRKFSIADVTYAGPASAERGPPPPAAPPTPAATVTLLSEPEGLVFNLVTGLIVEGRRGPHLGRVYQPLCSAPCTIGLLPGVQQLALSRPGELPRTPLLVTIPSGSSEFHGYYESRAGVRVAGWIFAAAAAVTGAALLVTGVEANNECFRTNPYTCHSSHAAQIIGGALLFGLGTPVGIIIANTPDLPHIDARGQSSPAPTPQKAPSVEVTGGF